MILTNFKGACYDAEMPPCKDCASRCAGCHATCAKYTAWNERHLERKERSRLANQMERCTWTPSFAMRRKKR